MSRSVPKTTSRMSDGSRLSAETMAPTLAGQFLPSSFHVSAPAAPSTSNTVFTNSLRLSTPEDAAQPFSVATTTDASGLMTSSSTKLPSLTTQCMGACWSKRKPDERTTRTRLRSSISMPTTLLPGTVLLNFAAYSSDSMRALGANAKPGPSWLKTRPILP